jgi:WD40 repeat protein
VAFSPDGRILLTCGSLRGGKGGTAQLWDAATGQRLGPPLGHESGPVRSASFSPSGDTVLTVSAKAVHLWKVATGEPLGRLEHPDQVFSAVYSPDGKTILTGCGDRIARLWDVDARRPLALPVWHRDVVWSVAFSRDGKLCLTGSRDKTARLWDVAQRVAIGPPFELQSGLTAVAMSPDGRTILTACQDGTAHLWEAPTLLESDGETVTLWVQVLAGKELDAIGVLCVLDDATWQRRRQRLAALGSAAPPLWR